MVLYFTDELVLVYGQGARDAPSLTQPNTYATRGNNTICMEHLMHNLASDDFEKMEPKSPEEIYNAGAAQIPLAPNALPTGLSKITYFRARAPTGVTTWKGALTFCKCRTRT